MFIPIGDWNCTLRHGGIKWVHVKPWTPPGLGRTQGYGFWVMMRKPSDRVVVRSIFSCRRTWIKWRWYPRTASGLSFGSNACGTRENARQSVLNSMIFLMGVHSLTNSSLVRSSRMVSLPLCRVTTSWMEKPSQHARHYVYAWNGLIGLHVWRRIGVGVGSCQPETHTLECVLVEVGSSVSHVIVHLQIILMCNSNHAIGINIKHTILIPLTKVASI